VRITLGQLRKIIREEMQKDPHRNKPYTKELLDDPFFKEDSIYVPDDIKEKIVSWAKDIKMSSK